MEGTEGFRRERFSPARLEGLIAFCVANGSPFDAALLRRLLLELTSDPAGVVAVDGPDGLALAAVVIDRTENGADAALFELLGVAEGGVPAAAFRALVAEPTVAFARAGARRVLHAMLHPTYARIEDGEAALRRVGFTPAFDELTMARAPGAPEPEVAALPDGWRWASIEEGPLVDGVHALLSDAFRTSASFALSPLPVFRRGVATKAALWRGLLHGDRLAGAVQVSADADTPRAELRTVARAPAYRGRGLGPQLVAEGLRVLRTLGAGSTPIELCVEDRNARARALYRRFGFEVVGRKPVLELVLRSAARTD